MIFTQYLPVSEPLRPLQNMILLTSKSSTHTHPDSPERTDEGLFKREKLRSIGKLKNRFSLKYSLVKNEKKTNDSGKQFWLSRKAINICAYVMNKIGRVTCVFAILVSHVLTLVHLQKIRAFCPRNKIYPNYYREYVSLISIVSYCNTFMIPWIPMSFVWNSIQSSWGY